MPPSLNVFWKELLSFVRDRRALLNQVVLPLVLMPLFMFGPSYLVERLSSQAAAEAQRVAVRGAPEALEQALKEVGLVVVPEPEPEAAVREGRADAGLVYEEGRVAVYLALAQGGMKAEVLKGRIEHALGRYKAALVEARLRAAGLD
ncbi:MAG TPA: ABC transporter permease, partial [Oceanithermus sp.]|nr:ABC transporter permease [Oceanithermus sp.]